MNERIQLLALLALGGCVATAGVRGTDDGSGDTVQASPADEGSEGNTTTTVVAEPVDDPEPAAAAATDPIDCAGQEEIVADAVTIVNEGGPAILARGNCKVTLTNSTVTGSDFGVDASGNAQVTLQDSRVEGGEAAVVSSGNANVALPGTEVVGEVRVQGNGEADGAAVSAMGMGSMGMSHMGMGHMGMGHMGNMGMGG